MGEETGREGAGRGAKGDGLEEAEATIQKGKQREIVFLARETKLTELAAHEWTLVTYEAE